MEYNFREIEKKWQEAWKETGIYQVSNASDKPKYYVLDMFPYPSGAGLHVGIRWVILPVIFMRVIKD